MPPRSIFCYICGRPYLAPSIDIHIAQCRELFEKRESLKPPKERRKCPPDPRFMSMLDQGGSSKYKNGSPKASASAESFSGTSGNISRNTMLSGLDSRLAMSMEQPTAGLYGMNECPDCHRTFSEEALARHVRICKKVFMEKRKPFDSAAARAKGTELASTLKRSTAAKSNIRHRNTSHTANASVISKNSTFPQSTAKAEGSFSHQMATSRKLPDQDKDDTPKWKEKSESFREAMKLARQVARAEKMSKETGIPLHQLLPADMGSSIPSKPAGFITCPTCNRSFNEQAANRHIPQCANIINKPSFLHRGRGVPSYSTNTPEVKSSTGYIPVPSQVSKISESSGSSRLPQPNTNKANNSSNVRAQGTIRVKSQENQHTATHSSPSDSSKLNDSLYLDPDMYRQASQSSKITSDVNKKTTESEAPRSEIKSNKQKEIKHSNRSVMDNSADHSQYVDKDEDMPKWKSRSEELREGMKLARQVTLAEKKSKETGIPLHQLLPADMMPKTKPIDYIACPTCGRSFSEQAGNRHIPQCKNIVHKPTMLHRGSGVPSYSTNADKALAQPNSVPSQTSKPSDTQTGYSHDKNRSNRMSSSDNYYEGSADQYQSNYSDNRLPNMARQSSKGSLSSKIQSPSDASDYSNIPNINRKSGSATISSAKIDRDSIQKKSLFNY